MGSQTVRHYIATEQQQSLALFTVMLPKAHLTSHSRMSGSRWVITPSWFSSVKSLSQLCPTVSDPMTAAHQASLSITNPQSLLKLGSIESVIPSNHLILCRPFLPPQSFSASGSFPMSQFFTSGGQSIWISASASVLPMNIQDWFPLGND